MAAVTVLLLMLMLSINGLALFMFEQQSDTVLDNLVETNGMFMKAHPNEENKKKLILFPEIDIMRSARFFIVELDEYGSALFANVDQIFYVSMDEAVSFAKTALDKGDEKGRIDRYKYAIKKIDDGDMVFFLDMTREMVTMRTLLLVSVVIAAGSWLIVLLFVVLLSKRFVRPIIAGMEKQKQFITNAGHELKTPLAIIQSNNDAMTLIQGETKYNRNIKDQVVRLNELTANLLTQAKLDEEVVLPKEHLNISELAGSVIQPYKVSAENKQIGFTAEIAPDIMFNANRDSFTQLLTLLLDNAVKYTSDEGDIRFTLTKGSRHILITEENSCSPDLKVDPERLFERFYRADSARTQQDQHSGYGIGLSVARSICESMGGKLTASYPEDGRIRFEARL